MINQKAGLCIIVKKTSSQYIHRNSSVEKTVLIIYETTFLKEYSHIEYRETGSGEGNKSHKAAGFRQKTFYFECYSSHFM
jgi:hypothetical protein